MNTYLIYKDYAEILIFSEKYGKFNAKIDLSDLGICQKYTWGIAPCRNKKLNQKIRFYVKNGKLGHLHRFLMNYPKGIVDHENLDTLDNRRNNLRKATCSQSQMNKGLYKNNISGYPGVCWHKKASKWVVHIKKDNIMYHIGYYDNLDSAIDAKKKAEIEFFGEYRNKNL